MSIDQVNLATVEKMWRREVEAAATYKHLAERERDPKRRDILLRLAAQEDKHASRWSERIAATTGRAPDPGQVERGLTWFQRISDPNVVLHRLEQEENKAEAEYVQLMARLSDPLDRRIAEDAMHEPGAVEAAEQHRQDARPRRFAEQQRHAGRGQSEEGHHHDDVEHARRSIEAQDMRGPEGRGDRPGTGRGNRHGGRLRDRGSHGRFSWSFIERRNHSRLCRPKNAKQPGMSTQ